jgi:hypothetical protein
VPFTYVFDPVARVVRVSARGVIRIDDLASHLQSLVDAGLAHVPQLIDAREAQHDLSVADMRRLVQLVQKVPSGASPRRTALVVASMVDYGMARMYGTLATETDPGFAVFQDPAEAEAWLAGAA